MLGIKGLADASFRGDERWRRAAKWTGYAPWFVFVIGILSMVEIALGAVWIASLKTDLNLYVSSSNAGLPLILSIGVA
jgi:hypothetical protein